MSRQASERARDEQFWKRFVDDFFVPDGILRHVIKDTQKSHTKQFEVFFPSLPRYFFVHYDVVEQVQITIENPNEKAAVNAYYVVEAPVAKFIYWFKNGTQVRCVD